MASLDARATVLRTARGDVQLAREGRGPPVLVIHGSPGGFDLGLAWCRHLRDGGCELHAPSRPGYLRTPLESGRGPQDQADLYAAMRDTLHVERATIMGFSSGGPSAVHFAARPPTGPPRSCSMPRSCGPTSSPSTRSPVRRSRPGWASGSSTGSPRGARAGSHGSSSTAPPAGWTRPRGRRPSHGSRPTRRLQGVEAASAAVAPLPYRKPGRTNDEANEAGLAPLPFAGIAAPTLIAHGTKDGVAREGPDPNARSPPRPDSRFAERGVASPSHSWER